MRFFLRLGRLVSNCIVGLFWRRILIQQIFSCIFFSRSIWNLFAKVVWLPVLRRLGLETKLNLCALLVNIRQRRQSSLPETFKYWLLFVIFQVIRPGQGLLPWLVGEIHQHTLMWRRKIGSEMLNWKIHTYIAGHFLYTDHSQSCPQASATGENHRLFVTQTLTIHRK